MTATSVDAGWSLSTAGAGWIALMLALPLAALAWWLYRRQVQRASTLRRVALPLLRAAAVFLIVSMLAMPSVDWRHIVDRRGRVIIVTDTSASMQINDDQMSTGRKLLIARSLELADVSAMDFTLADAADAIEKGDDRDAIAASLRQADIGMFANLPAHGFATLQRWDRVSRSDLSLFDRSELTSGNADATSAVSSLRFPHDSGGNFARRIVGRLRPPATAEYTFHLAVGNRAEFFLDSGQGLRSIIRTSKGTLPDDFDTNRSLRFPLQAAESYNFELRQQASTMDDHLTLAWSINGGPPEVISEDALSPIDEALEPETMRQRLLEALQDSINDPALIERLDEQFDHYATAQVATDASVATAATVVDRTTRASRVAALLQMVESDIRANADVTALDAAMGQATDLRTPLTSVSGREVPQAIILLTDGRHTADTDLSTIVGVASSLGRVDIPIHAVAVGSTQMPHDIVLTQIDGPNEVHAADHVSGQIILHDSLPPGQPLAIRAVVDTPRGEIELWRGDYLTTNEGRREIDFEFQLDRVGNPTSSNGLQNDDLLVIRFETEPVDGEFRDDNNTAILPIRVTQRRQRILLIDGRPRWDSRFIETALGRQSRYETRAITSLERSGRIEVGPTGFPATRESLLKFDIIILGEIPRSAWSDDQLRWIADFVQERGGGLIAIDGIRGRWAEYQGAAIDTLLPIERGRGEPTLADNLLLTSAGRAAESLRLEPAADRNAQLWANLPSPRWALDIQQRAGVGEVLLDVVTASGDSRPSVVSARVGRGRVVYVGFDETWRWRKDAENRWQSRFWSGLINSVREPTFSGEDAYVAIGVDAASVTSGETLAVRARLKDESGNFIAGDNIADARVTATMLRDGAPVATAPLQPDAAGGGLWRGSFEVPAQPGRYEIAIFQDEIAELEQTARAAFIVTPPDNSAELARLDVDLTMLKSLADASGGTLAREEDARSLATRFDDFTTHSERRGRYDLWSSWPLFVSIAGLLCVEWFIRRRGGMI